MAHTKAKNTLRAANCGSETFPPCAKQGGGQVPYRFDARRVAVPVQRVLGTLEAHGCNPRRNGSGWRAHCPSHEDRRPSLSISEGRQGRVLLRCWSGCETRDVLATVGLRWSDLFPSRVAVGRGHVSP